MPLSRELGRALLWGGLLSAYGNGFNLLVSRTPPSRRGLLGIGGPVVLTACLFAWHRAVDRGPLAALGLHGQRWRGGVVWGAVSGALLAVLPVLFFRPLAGRGMSVQFNEVCGLGLRSFLCRLLITTPLLVAFAEEFAFRGFLQRKLQQALPERPVISVGLSSLSFALWHVVVNLRTLGETNVISGHRVPLPVALAAGLLSVFAGGLVFGGLFHATGSLVGPVMSHWVVDALMLLALYRPDRGLRTED
jgi:membrane protease YdiL (CAAX protease family)